MGEVINIHTKGYEIDLEAGKHKVDVLGGWGVVLGAFTISFRNTRTGLTIYCKKPFLMKEFFVLGKRARRIFTFYILDTGTYEVIFEKPETIILKHTNLFFFGLLESPIPNNKVAVYIQ